MTLFAWHVHHEVLMEPLTEPIENRIAYIKGRKPATEVPTRLRLMKKVNGKLPAAVVKAWDASDKARDAYVKARDAHDKAWDASDKAWDASAKARDAYDKAYQDNLPAIEALHAKECPDCPWDGKTIFPEEQP